MNIFDGGFTMTQDCISTSICAESAGGSGANFPGSSTTTYEADDIETMPVTVTAGASKITAAAAGSATATTSAGSTTMSSSSELASASSASAGAKLTTLVGGQSTASQTSASTASGTETAAASGSTSTGAAIANARAPVDGLGLFAAAVGVLGMLA